jgi:hypothetical protein
MFTEFETTLRASYSHRTTYFTREILFISRNISFTSLSRSFFSRGPWNYLSTWNCLRAISPCLYLFASAKNALHVLDQGAGDGSSRGRRLIIDREFAW